MIKYFIFIPNLLSIIRIALVYPILNNIYVGTFETSIIFFLIASFTDALDGYLARKMDWQTELGRILDPVADKLLLSGTVFIFWINNFIPFYIFVIFISRDVAILIGAAIQMSLIESDTTINLSVGYNNFNLTENLIIQIRSNDSISHLNDYNILSKAKSLFQVF